MKKRIYQIVYTGWVNRIVRTVLLPLTKLTGKRYISVSGRIDVKLKNNVAQFKMDTNQTCSATQELFYNGPENYEFTELFIPLIQKVDTFFDIGANVGYFSLLAAKLNPKVKIYAFEPSIGPLHYLKENIKLNRLDQNVTVVGKAVSDVDGTLTFHSVVSKKYPWINYNLNGSHSLQNSYGLEKQLAYPVEVISLQQFKKAQEIEKVDLIKLDTECTEHLIFESSLELINEDRPIIISELYDVIKPEMHSIILRMENYQLYQINRGQLVKMDSILDEPVFKGEANFLFCPEEKQGLIEQFILR
jgi:FkbM family methyltransferase